MEKYFKEFDDYVNSFDMNDSNNITKYKHSYRVMWAQNKYGNLIGFDENNCKLASIIGLLHDIGRFKQYEEYSTFSDIRSVDHADLGVDILFDEGLIERFWNNEDDYDTINFSIKNHNKLSLEKNDDINIMNHAKLIRDTDKLDILYLLGVLGEYNKRYSDKVLSDKIVESIFNHKPVNINDVEHPNDAKATYFAFPFDINNIEVLNELRVNLNCYYNLVNHDKIFDEIYNEVNKYIDDRLGNKKLELKRS